MSVNIKENNALTRVAGNAADLNKWIGTKAEWDALDHGIIPEGTEVIITDDEYPTKVCRTVSECVDNTDENALAGASTVKEMNDNLTFPDGIGFYPDVKDGVRGYNTDAARGADTFHPFSSINEDSFVVISTGTSWNVSIDNALSYKAIIICCDLSSTNAVNNMATATVSGGKELLTQGVIHDNGQGGIFTVIVLPTSDTVSVTMSNTTNFNYGRHVAYGIK